MATELLRKYLQKILGSLDVITLENVLQKFNDLGVESVDDINYVQEEDFFSILKPIQARKLCSRLTNKAQGQLSAEPEVMNCQDAGQGRESQVNSALNDLGTTSSSNGSTEVPRLQEITSETRNFENYDWVQSYVFSLSNLKKDVQIVLLEGNKLNPAQRHEFIRAVADDILKLSIRPVKKELRIIAMELVRHYPKSLKDTLDGQILGSGFESLLTQLVNRVENVTRDGERRKHFPLRKRKKGNKNDENSAPQTRRQSMVSHTSSYGCTNFDQDISEDDKVSMKADQETLKYLIANREEVSADDLTLKIKATYPLQRIHINDGLPVQELLKEWPFLFEEIGLIIHVNELLHKDLKQTTEDGFKKWVQKCLDYFNTSPKASVSLKTVLSDVKLASRNAQNMKPKIAGFLVALMTYFQEPITALVHVNCPFEKVADRPGSIPLSPCIITSETSFLTASKFMLTVDGHVVNDHIDDVAKAITMLFACYFCFNVEYPKEASLTMEFIQTCIAQINLTGKSKERSIKPRVLKLINAIRDFDWTPV